MSINIHQLHSTHKNKTHLSHTHTHTNLYKTSNKIILKMKFQIE